MPRVRPADRFDQLVRAAAHTFIAAGGFHRTQIADIAAALGVAKGTVYLLADSKEALFDAALKHADSVAAIPTPTALPISSPSRDQASRVLRQRLAAESQFPLLSAACLEHRSADVAAELGAILGELYDTLERNRVTIKLLAVTAIELPKLAQIWFQNGRGRVVALLSAYLRRRAHSGAIPTLANAELAARLILETTSWFAVHRHFDRMPQPIEDDQARAEVIGALSRSYGPPPK